MIRVMVRRVVLGGIVAIALVAIFYHTSAAQRLETLYRDLHQPGSGTIVHELFPDATLIYTDAATNTRFRADVPPFEYYYSARANATFAICAIDQTVFICTGKLESEVSAADLSSGRCHFAPIYLLNDTRLHDLTLAP